MVFEFSSALFVTLLINPCANPVGERFGVEDGAFIGDALSTARFALGREMFVFIGDQSMPEGGPVLERGGVDRFADGEPEGFDRFASNAEGQGRASESASIGVWVFFAMRGQLIDARALAGPRSQFLKVGAHFFESAIRIGIGRGDALARDGFSVVDDGFIEPMGQNRVVVIMEVGNDSHRWIVGQAGGLGKGA